MEGFWEFLYPKFCCLCGQWGEWLCGECKKGLGWVELKCPSCGRQTVGGGRHERCGGGLAGLRAVYDYKQEEVRRVVKVFKYKYVREMGRLLLEGVDVGVKRGEFDLLIPVALHKRRENFRGFNQAEVLAGLLEKRGGGRVLEALERVRYTQPLVELESYKKRKREIEGVFRVKDRYKGEIKGKRVLLVDDVFTSGSTLQEAAGRLKQAGVGEVWGWVLASR